MAAHLPGVVKNLAKPPIAACKHTFQNTGLDVVPTAADLTRTNGFYQMLLLGNHHVHRVLRLPLKRSKRLGNKGGNTDRYIDPLALGAVGHGIIKVKNAVRELNNTRNILHRFSRKAQHKIKLDRGIAAFKRNAAGIHDLLFGDIFVNDVAQALGSSLRRKSKPTFTYLFDALQQLF